jgi:hypothetical protein
MSSRMFRRTTRVLLVALLGGLLTTACGTVTISGVPRAASAPAPAGSATTVPTVPAVPTARPSAAPTPRSAPATPVLGSLDQDAPAAALEVADHGFSAYAVEYTGIVTSYAVRLRNPNPAPWRATSATLQITFTDANGAVVLAEQGPFIADIGPGQTTAFGSTATRDATGIATAMHVEVVDANWTDGMYRAAGEITTGPATARPVTGTGSDKVLIDCAASSTYLSKVAGLFVSVVYLDPQGRIIGGSQHNSDVDGNTLSVPGGGSAPFTLQGYFAPPNGVPAAECSVNYVRPA